jgi:hypothetical protein
MIAKIVTIVCAVGGVLLAMAALSSSDPCEAGSKGWKEVCNLQGRNGDIRKMNDDSYLDGWIKAVGEVK